MATEKLYDDWQVQLAKTYDPAKPLKPGTWISISQKINGTRATYFCGSLISRTGHKFEGLKHIIDELKRLTSYINKHFGFYPVFDGELRLADEYTEGLSDNEIFKKGNGIANKTLSMSEKYKLNFIIFDIHSTTFWAHNSVWHSYAQRISYLIYEFNKSNEFRHISLVPILYQGYDLSEIEKQSNIAQQNNWEGIMINLDTPYQFKRTSNLLKYKAFNTIDLKIVGFTEGIGKYRGTLGALLCEYKDNIVGVGTGLNDADRNYIWENREIIKGTICEVKYKDTTYDKDTGLESLQFPVFLGLRFDKEEPDV
ncbi:MAG: hypothetical protein IKU15_00175 [Clostridia bacterium]|nr:hypothetical protein [Clostridia bacterium]